MEVTKAKMQMAKYANYLKTPFPVKNKREICKTVDIKDVPDYNATAVLKNEWCLEHHHFKWRRRQQRAYAKKKAEAAKAAKKKKKGK